MTRIGATKIARVNGINIGHQVRGNGPPLVLIMGYRLSSLACPTQFVKALAEEFTVVTFDNRGTGQSDKPVKGYALANMARDLAGLLDEIGIERTYVLGYSMGGAIAQEFTRQFPLRVAGLILCATMCGGPRATFAEPQSCASCAIWMDTHRSRSHGGSGRSPTLRVTYGNTARRPRIRAGDAPAAHRWS